MSLDKLNLTGNSPSKVIRQFADGGTASIYDGICEYIEYAVTDSRKGIVSLVLTIPHSKPSPCYKSFTNTWTRTDPLVHMTYAVEKKYGIRYMEWWHKGGSERSEIARILRKTFKSKRNTVTEELKRLHNEEFQVLYSSPNHCATSRKVAGSIPDSVIGIFQLHNPSDRTVALGSTQFPTEISARNISWR